MSNEPELFEKYVKKEYPFLNLARSTRNADEYSSATVCVFWEFWKAGIATMQDDVVNWVKNVPTDELINALDKCDGAVSYAVEGLQDDVRKDAWISVEDSIPDDGLYVIVAFIKNGDVWNWDKARYSSTAKRWMKGNNYASHFNHWKPAPIDKARG